MITKTIRSRFDHEVGGTVEGATILEKSLVIAPDPVEKRRGVYEYVVEVPPAPMKAQAAKGQPARKAAAAERGTFTRATPDQMGSVIRRLPSR